MKTQTLFIRLALNVGLIPRYRGSDEGEEYASTFAKGDVVGAGVHLERQEIFFTKNGKYLKVRKGELVT